MLDFAPDGIDGLSQVARYLGGTAVIMLGILIATGLMFFAIGRAGGTSRAQEKGFRMVMIGTASVAVLTSVSAGIAFGISRGGEDYLPAGATQQNVTVEREAPSTTCREDAVRNFDSEPNPPSQAEREALLETLTEGGLIVSQGAAGEPAFYVSPEDADTNATMLQSGTVEEITTLKWRAPGDGGDCSANVESAAPGSTVELEVVISGSQHTVDYTMSND